MKSGGYGIRPTKFEIILSEKNPFIDANLL